jgi:hypothetical protein
MHICAQMLPSSQDAQGFLAMMRQQHGTPSTPSIPPTSAFIVGGASQNYPQANHFLLVHQLLRLGTVPNVAQRLRYHQEMRLTFLLSILPENHTNQSRLSITP